MLYLGRRTAAKDIVVLEQLREKLTAARTYYVRSDGNDGNTGLSDTAGGAFLTIQKAVDVATMLDNAGNLVTISVANGTYGAFLLRSYVGSQAPKVVGNTATPGSVVISATGTAIGCTNCGAWTLSGMRVQSTSGAGLSCVGAGTLITLSDSFEFSACASQHMISTDDARLNIACPWRIAGNAAAHINTVRGASVLAFAQTCTIVGSIALTYFVYAETASDILIQSVTFSGTLTGKRYEVTLNAVVQTYGGGASYFPGNSAGTVSTGGQYA